MNFSRTLAVVTGALAICLSAQGASAQARGPIPDPARATGGPVPGGPDSTRGTGGPIPDGPDSTRGTGGPIPDGPGGVRGPDLPPPLPPRPEGRVDVGVNKRGPGQLTAGQSVTFTLTAYNVGPATVGGANNIKVVDTLPAGFTGIAASGGGWSCQVLAQTVTCTWTGGAIAAGGSFPAITVTAIVGSQRSYVNCAEISVGRGSDANKGNNKNCVEGPIKPGEGGGRYDVGIRKTGPAVVAAGQSAIFTLAPFNTGPSPVSGSSGVTVTDTLPINFTQTTTASGNGWNCSVSGTSPVVVSCTYFGPPVAANTPMPQILITTMAKGPGGYVNCADINLKAGRDTNPRDNRGCSGGQVNEGGGKFDLSLGKRALDGPWTFPTGGTFRLTVTNASSTPLPAGSVITIEDTLSPGMTLDAVASSPPWNCSPVPGGGLITCTYALTGSLTGGGTVTLDLKVHLTGEPRQTYENCAKVSAADRQRKPVTETTYGNNQACDKVTVDKKTEGKPDVSITKTAERGPWSWPGGTGYYEIKIANVGGTAIPAGHTFEVTESIPTGMTFAGASGPWSCLPGAGAQGPVPVVCTYVSTAALSPGAWMIFTVQVGFNGPKQPAYNNCVQVRVLKEKAVWTEINRENNRDCEPVDVKGEATRRDLSFEKTALYPPWPIPGIRQFQLTATNSGGVAIAAGEVIRMKDTLPAGLGYIAPSLPWTCTTSLIGSSTMVDCQRTLTTPLSPGQSLSMTLNVLVNGPPGTYENCAGVAASAAGSAALLPETTFDNNNDCVTVPVVASVLDVGIDKQGPASLFVGQTATFVLQVTNNSNLPLSAGAGITVIDTLPPVFNPPATASGGPDWDCQVIGLKVTCAFQGGQPINPGDPLPPITITAVAGKAGETENCARVELKIDTPEANGDNNKDCIPVVVRPGKPVAYDLSLDKQTVPGPWTSGGQFDLLITNHGSDLPAGAILRVQDALPPGMQLTAVSASWACTPGLPMTGPATVTCLQTQVGGLPSGTSVLLQTTMAFVGPGRPSYENCARVTALSPAPGNPTLTEANLINNKDCEVVVTTPPAQHNLSLDKQLLDSTWGPVGGAYRLRTTNAGTATIPVGTVLTITDSLPPGLWLAGVPAPYNCSPGPGIQGPVQVTCTVTLSAPLPPGGAVNFDLTVGYFAPVQEAYVNCAALSAEFTETTLTDNNDCVTSTRPDYDLKIDKHLVPGPWTFPTGGQFKILVTNSGAAPLPAGSTVHVTEIFPAGMTLGSAPSPWVCTTGSLATNCDLVLPSALAPGQAVTLTLPATFTGPLRDTYNNCASTHVMVDGRQLVETIPLTNNEDCETVTPSTTTPTAATLEIEKVVDQDCTGTPPSTQCKFIIRILNTSQTPYSGPLTFTDTVTSFGNLTGGVSLATPLPPGWTCTGVQPVTCALSWAVLGPSAIMAIPVYMTINGAVPPTQNCASLTVPEAAAPSCVPMGNTHHDLGLDSNFLPAPVPAPPGQKELSYWISSAPTVANGSQIILNGSLTSSATFAPMTVATPGWNCSGGWASFVCSLTVAPGSFSGSLIPLKLRTSYAPGFSGQAFTYVGTVTMNGNVDPVNSNSTRTITSTLP